jgi:hypothetical protein
LIEYRDVDLGFAIRESVKILGRRCTRNAVVVPEGLPDPSALGSADLLNGDGSQPAEQAVHPVGLGRKRFILFWWAAGVVIMSFLVISGFLNSLVRTGFWLSGCFLNIHDYQKLYMQYPFTNLISLLPYIISITLWMVLQWQVLKTEVPVSRWWIAAPVLAGIPLLIWMPPALSCNDVADLALPSIFPALNSPAATVLSVVFYFLIIGFIQWLVLRRKLKISVGWTAIPFLSAGVETGLTFLLVFLGMAFISMVRPDKIGLPALIGWALIVLVLATIFNLVPGFYLHRAIHKKQTSLVPPLDNA